jgi:hypothetical protein
LSGLALIGFGGLMLLACLSAAAGPGRHDQTWVHETVAPQGMPPIPFRR